MGISSISSQFVGSITKSKPMQKCCNYFKKNPEKAIAYATLTSLVGKDGIGCYLYVTQSLNNKRIPDDKRRFVAAMDLTNGILMMASQIAFFFAMRKFNEPIFNKLFQKSFDKEGKMFKTVATQIRKTQKDAQIAAQAAGKEAGHSVTRKPELKEEYDALRGTCIAAFKNVVNIVAATILAKRVFVPFVSTPLAQYCTNKVDQRNAKKAAKNGQANDQQPAKVEAKNEPTQNVKPETKIETLKSEESNLLKKFQK